MNYNHLIYLTKNFTKIWRCHVMSLNHFCAIIYLIHSFDILSSTLGFQIWSSGQFYTTTYLNISLKHPPKLWDVNRSIWFNFMQKPSYILWKIWVIQPNFISGPTWWFVLQPYFNLLLYPWFFFLLVVLPTKPLSPGAWTHWNIFGPWNDSS